MRSPVVIQKEINSHLGRDEEIPRELHLEMFAAMKTSKNQVVKARDKVAATKESSAVHWKLLHEFRLEVWKPALAKAFYQRWREGIPKLNCNCRKDWKDIEKKYPPDFTSQDAFFSWGVARHNDINRKLGKPQLQLLDAFLLYS